MKKMTRIAAVVLALTISVAPFAGAQAACHTVAGHIAGQLIGPTDACGGALTEVGTFTGDVRGTFIACETGFQQLGDGTLIFDLAHTYTTIDGDTFTTTDHVIATPKKGSEYRIDNSATVTGGTGDLQNASGFVNDHGTVDLATGVVLVEYHGQICTP